MVAGGFGIARLLGFLFSVASGRALGPADFGRMSYALTVASLAGIVVTTAPTGLARFLSRSGVDGERSAYYSNWLVVVLGVLSLSVVAAMPYGVLMGLAPAMLVGVGVNLAGAATLETFREVERGLNHFSLFSAYYVLANVLQLLAVLALTAARWSSPELFVIVYGGSSLAALLVVRAFTPVGVSLDLRSLQLRRMWNVLLFIRPVLLQSIFWNVWFVADVVFVQHRLGSAAVGNYAAAKAIANGFAILPSAIVYVLVPNVARLEAREVRGQLTRALFLTAAVSAPIAAGVGVLSGPAVALLFGQRYPGAAAPTVLLVIGMLVFGFKAVLGAVWLGLGHPLIEALSAGVAMVATLLACVWLVPAAGLTGAAASFLIGAVAQLLVMTGVTVWALAGERPRVGQLGDQAILEGANLDG